MEGLAKIFGKIGRLFSWIVWTPLENGEQKRQLNTKRLLTLVLILTTSFVIYALLAPSLPKYVGEFRENLPPEAERRESREEARAIDQATATTQKAFTAARSASPFPAGNSGAGGSERNSAMILSRPGVNSSNQLPAGVKITARLMDGLNIGAGSVPVIAEVVRGIFNDSGGGIAEGSRIFGMAQFQNGEEFAQIQFQSIADPSGNVREFQGMALDGSGQAGVAGDVRSKGLSNATGQFVSRFVGAYADGSQSRNNGTARDGAENALLSAVSDTAKERANNYAEDLKKEHEWIEIPKGKEITVILTRTFTFSEPGVNQ